MLIRRAIIGRGGTVVTIVRVGIQPGVVGELKFLGVDSAEVGIYDSLWFLIAPWHDVKHCVGNRIFAVACQKGQHRLLIGEHVIWKRGSIRGVDVPAVLLTDGEAAVKGINLAPELAGDHDNRDARGRVFCDFIVDLGIPKVGQDMRRIFITAPECRV